MTTCTSIWHKDKSIFEKWRRCLISPGHTWTVPVARRPLPWEVWEAAALEGLCQLRALLQGGQISQTQGVSCAPAGYTYIQKYVNTFCNTSECFWCWCYSEVCMCYQWKGKQLQGEQCLIMKVQKWHQECYFSDFQGSHNKQNTSVLCFVFVASLCLPPKKWTFYSPLVCFALLSMRMVTCDLLGMWPVFPDCALANAISCFIWHHRDETTSSKLIANMTLASSALEALYHGNSCASLTWYRESLVFIAYKWAKRWLIELLSSLLQMRPAFWSCSLKSTINHLKVSFLLQAQSNVDWLRNWGRDGWKQSIWQVCLWSLD